MSPISHLNNIAQPLAVAATAVPARWTPILLAALLNLLPGALMANAALRLPVRGVSAIVCGLMLLLIGPYVIAHSLPRWARHCGILAG